MANTSQTFSNFLNQYLPYELLENELIKRNYLFSRIDIDKSWKQGTLVVPFFGGAASSIAFGSLTGSTDIAEDTPVSSSCRLAA